MTAQPDERRTLLEVLDLLCRDSLEVPLSHVDHPDADGDITALFREMRDGVVALQEALTEWLIVHGEPTRFDDLSERTRRLLEVRGSVGDSERQAA